jgi:hypothetical protein
VLKQEKSQMESKIHCADDEDEEDNKGNNNDSNGFLTITDVPILEIFLILNSI